MEDDCAGRCPKGLVPSDLLPLREAIIGIFTAALVASGHHSFAECIVVAQEMGYFQDIPQIGEHALSPGGSSADHKSLFQALITKLSRIGLHAPGITDQTGSGVLTRCNTECGA